MTAIIIVSSAVICIAVLIVGCFAIKKAQKYQTNKENCGNPF